MFRQFPDKILTAMASLLVITTLQTATRADDLDNIIFEGTVRDIAGAVVADARIIARNKHTGAIKVVSSDADGHYRVVVNEPGDYLIKASADGFRDAERVEVGVVSGRRLTIDFSLSPIGVSAQATVLASNAPLIDTSRTVVGDTINGDELQQLPLIDRDPLRLVFLLGGATEAPLSTRDLADEGRGRFFRSTPEEAGIFSLTGAPATSNNITIDGLDNNDDRTARERITLSPEAISELQIITNQYAAEYGRASGGRINIRTRGGTNQLHGDFYAYFGDESLNANTFFRNARGLGRIPQQVLREGGSFSGPIRRDRLLFFVNYERLDLKEFAEINVRLPVKTNPLFPLPKPNQPPEGDGSIARLIEEVSTPETKNTGNARVDFNFSSSHNAAVRADIVRGENLRSFPGGTRLPETILIEGRDSDSISVIDNLVISDHILNQTRVQFSRLLPRNSADSDSVGVVIQGSNRLVAGSFTGSQTSPSFARREKRSQIQDNLSLLIGKHMLKLGGDLQLVRAAFDDLFAAGGQFTFDSLEDFLASQPSRFIQRFNTSSHLSNNVLGIFIQDEFKIKPNLTLSVGVRWDNESVVNDRDNFSPRIAIAWDPFGNKLTRSRLAEAGKTVVRAGFGLFYNRALLRTLDDFSLGRSTIILDSDIKPELLKAVRFPSPVTDPRLISEFGVTEAKFLRRVSKDIEIPYTLQTGLGIERQIGSHLVVSADYIFTRGAHLWRETNVNAPLLPKGFASFTQYLMSRDFDNRPDANGTRPISGAKADVVRFDLGTNTSSSAGAIKVEQGVRVLTLGLNAPRSSNIKAAMNAIRFLRPDPALNEIELLESTGNSFYHGGIFSVRYSAGRRVHFRAAYTLSKFIDEGTTNTASPQNLFDRRAERALSLQDQRHRFSFGGLFQLPYLGIDLAPIVSFGSSRPFNIGAGVDRNLNDIENDRPNFVRDIGRPVWRRPGSQSAEDVRSALVLATIGSDGNLPRNYGKGPGTRTIDLRASRTFALNERARIRPAIEVFNLFNSAIFSFGSEFINRDDADFLIPRRTQRPRTVHLSLKLFF
jgi:hypothetical protein